MKRQLLMGALAMGALTAGSLGQVNPAEALTIDNPCSASYASNVVTNGGCELGTTNNDFVSNPLQVNQDSLFGYTDWNFLQKDLETNTDLDFLTGNRISGTFDISAFVQPSWTDVMLVFKGGGGNITPDKYVGYLLNSLTGSWTTPFSNARNGNPAEVSHVSLYYRTGTPIPTPALLPGLIGMGLAAMRKKKQAAEVAQEA